MKSLALCPDAVDVWVCVWWATPVTEGPEQIGDDRLGAEDAWKTI